ncbi:type III secretion system stator protein SctL [Pseudomonas sp. FP1742]|uniref:type III secretion system stator protein SctL n=1 Tax=Pseudomonas sp. FP1742 TaxID=2954079 RepID=UPI0027368035|nr:type III secretion system stator protein SctL [Pseudomonas sp. FP1742]WLG48113.1 type III secretion system stator protein SctL [Pseudomonas sp. FP1742]
MLAVRKLTLAGDCQLIGESLLRREEIDDCLLAGQVLEAAREQAKSILDAALTDARALREVAAEQAQAQVWEQAQALLDDWRAQREQMWEGLNETARQLLDEALRTLLAEVPEPARIDTLLRHLKAAQPHDEASVLHCHPDLAHVLAERLPVLGHSNWTVRADPQLPADGLSLRASSGDFNLSWQALQRWVLPEQERLESCA